MERGVYFDAWFPRQHCYHPSLPPRRLKMIEDLETYRATSLVWSALGGGSISLPYLEEEAWGEVDPRFRFYGFLNDAEFIRHCQERGIKVFGIVFEVQGWEFPVELNEDESKVLAMNELRGAGKRGWLGLREFTQNTYPKLWKPLEHYFPDGLVNSDGEKVTDILEECTSRDIYGNACHSTWVEVPGNEHYAYLMDRNNPVWREYLKAIIRIQIDAGVAGVQLDEADLPIFATGYGGCFCKDCMKLFRAYLQDLPEDRLPDELKGVDLDGFHYGSWLLERGYDFKANRESTPLYWTYIRFQRQTIVKYFAELSDYIKEYGASKGREVLVSGNFYYLTAHYYPFEPKVDVLITEMDSTSYRQPSWCRYAAGFAGSKPGIVIEDSFWAPHEVVVETQNFIAGHEELYSPHTYSETAVAFSVESNYQYLELHGSGEKFPFWRACDRLVETKQPFDVVMFPEGVLRADSIAPGALDRYRTLVLPHCSYLTDAQAAVVKAFMDRGGRVLALGDLGLNLPDDVRRGLLGHPRMLRATDLQASDLAGGPQIRLAGAPDLAINVQRVKLGAAVHLIRYDYDEARDEVPVLPRLQFDLRLGKPFRMAKAFSPTGTLRATLSFSREVREMHRLDLEDVPLYSVVLLQG